MAVHLWLQQPDWAHGTLQAFLVRVMMCCHLRQSWSVTALTGPNLAGSSCVVQLRDACTDCYCTHACTRNIIPTSQMRRGFTQQSGPVVFPSPCVVAFVT
jgi:hypothetical protein